MNESGDKGMETNGKGNIANVRNASKHEAHCIPNLSYTNIVSLPVSV
jgi:hypothetical protein